MIYSFTSSSSSASDSKALNGFAGDLNTTSFDITPPITSPHTYYVQDINFQNFLVTTTDDYIIFHVIWMGGVPAIDQDFKFNFPNKNDYDEDMIVDFLYNLINTDSASKWRIHVDKNDVGILSFHINEALFGSSLYINGITHRVKLLLGLVNYNNKHERVKNIVCSDRPDFCFGHMFYLNSFEAGNSMITKDVDGKIIGSSIAYIINQFIIPHLPVIVKNKHKQGKRTVNMLSHISFQLCDKYNVPIVLLSPMTIAIYLTPL
jgi:hypothetical protein